MKPEVFIIVSGIFYCDNDRVIAVGCTRSDCEQWLEGCGWKKSREPQNKGLWEKFQYTNQYWARIDASVWVSGQSQKRQNPAE